MEPIVFSPADEVKELAIDIVPEHHRHLIEVDILYLFTSKTTTSKGKPRIATVKRLTPLERWLHVGDSEGGEQVAIVFSRPQWDSIPAKHREAVVDHFLSYIGWDDEREIPVIVDSDVRAFTSNVARYGAWHRELEEFLRAAAPQLSLNLEAAAEHIVDLRDEEFVREGQIREPATAGV